MTLRGGVITVWRIRTAPTRLRRLAESDYYPSPVVSTMTLTDEQTAETGERSRAQSLRERLSRRFPRAGTMLVLAALILILNGLHVHAYTVISPFDENFHIDRLIRSSRFEFVQPDDKTSQESLDEVACRGTDDVLPWPPCMKEGRYKPEEFTYKGWNAESGSPPYYYVLTGVTAQGLRALAATHSLVTWARILGSLWLLIGVYFVVRAAEYFSVRRLPLVLGVVLVIASPSLLHASNTINTDASAFAAGAGVLLAGLAWERSRAPLWLLATAAAACALLDNTNALAVIIVLFYFLIRSFANRERELGGTVRPRRDYLVAGLVAATSAVLAVLAWRGMYAVFAHHVDLSQVPGIKTYHVDHLDLEMILGKDTLFAVFPPLHGYIPPILRTSMYEVYSQAAVLLAVGVLFAASLRARVIDRLSALGLSIIAALIVAPVVFVIHNYLFGSQFFHIVPRYSLTAFPAIAIVAAAVPRSRVGVTVLGIVAVGLYTSAAIALL